MTRATSQRNGRRRDSKAGFLLTETLATFTLSAFVLLGLVSASSVLLRAVDGSVAHVEDVDDLGHTINAIARDVAGLSRARWNGFEPQPFVFRGGPNSLFFAQTQRGADGKSETRVVALREIVADGGTRMMRGEARLSPRATAFDDLHFGPQRELGTGSARLRFFYVVPPGLKSARTRLREWPATDVLPSAIIVEAVARDTGQILASTRVPIRANADIGCLESKEQATIGSTSPTAQAGSNPTTVGTTAQPTPVAAGATGATPALGFCGRADKPKPEDDPRFGAGQTEPASSQAAARAPL